MAWIPTLVAEKVRFQRQVLRRAKRRGDFGLAGVAATLGAIAERVRAGAGQEAGELMGMEGTAAALYFDAFGRTLTQELGFVGRRKRPPPRSWSERDDAGPPAQQKPRGTGRALSHRSDVQHRERRGENAMGFLKKREPTLLQKIGTPGSIEQAVAGAVVSGAQQLFLGWLQDRQTQRRLEEAALRLRATEAASRSRRRSAAELRRLLHGTGHLLTPEQQHELIRRILTQLEDPGDRGE